MGILEIYAYNFLHDHAITMYSIFLESYDPGLSNKPRYMM
jgi:hypothetical protein